MFVHRHQHKLSRRHPHPLALVTPQHIGLNADRGFRGQAVALDARTGRQVWKFYVVPGPGEPGHETWPKDSDSWKTGGGAIWLIGHLQQELAIVPARFEYRAHRPAIAGRPLTLEGWREGPLVRLRTVDADGVLCMSAEATLG